MTTLAVLSLLVWLYLLLAHGRFWQSGPELTPACPVVAPPVTVVVPARDEAPVIGRTLRSLLAQDYAGPLTIVLVDDGSSDGTGEIARSLTQRIDTPLPPAGEVAKRSEAGEGLAAAPAPSPGALRRPLPQAGEVLMRQLTVLNGKPRPPGWSGKLWAVAQGLDEAQATDLVLLTDADIVHDSRHIATLVAQAESNDLDLVSEMVTLACNSRAEHALVPAFVYFFQLLYPFAWTNDPLRADRRRGWRHHPDAPARPAADRWHRGGARGADRRCGVGVRGEAGRSHLAGPFRPGALGACLSNSRRTSGAWCRARLTCSCASRPCCCSERYWR